VQMRSSASRRVGLSALPSRLRGGGLFGAVLPPLEQHHLGRFSLLGSRTSVPAVLPCHNSVTVQKRTIYWLIGEWYKRISVTEKQRVLAEDMRKGYWGDANELGKSREGKFFYAVPKLIKEQAALKFPIIKKRFRSWKWFHRVDLAEEFKKSPATLVIVTLSRLYCQPMIDSWRIPFEKEFPNLKLYELELVPQVGYWWFGPIIRYFQRKTTEPRRIPLTLFYNGIGKVTDMKGALNMTNRLVAYPFLVDQKGLIRWKAVGLAKPEEIEAMILVTKQLLTHKKE
jgi:hypothetical protein